jgi:hypothetical protein
MFYHYFLYNNHSIHSICVLGIMKSRDALRLYEMVSVGYLQMLFHLQKGISESFGNTKGGP